jgi:hypothetical protein
MRSLLLIESLDLRLSNQYILLSESPSCLRLEKMCVCQVRRRSRWSPRYSTWFSWGICTSFIWTGGHVSLLVVNVTWTDLVSLALICQSRSQDWIASRVVCSFGEVVAGSLSVATTAVSSAKWQWRSQARLEGQLYKVSIVMGRGHCLEKPLRWLG